MAEAAVMQQLRHPNVLLVFGVTLRAGATSTLAEVMSLGSVQDFMWPVRAPLGHQAAAAISHCRASPPCSAS